MVTHPLEVVMNEQREWVPYPEVIKRSGLSRRTLYDRLKEADITVYKNPRDRRLRLIAAADLPKLTEARPVHRRMIVAETA